MKFDLKPANTTNLRTIEMILALPTQALALLRSALALLSQTLALLTLSVNKAKAGLSFVKIYVSFVNAVTTTTTLQQSICFHFLNKAKADRDKPQACVSKLKDCSFKSISIIF